MAHRLLILLSRALAWMATAGYAQSAMTSLDNELLPFLARY
jgi:hypothetical protein